MISPFYFASVCRAFLFRPVLQQELIRMLTAFLSLFVGYFFQTPLRCVRTIPRPDISQWYSLLIRHDFAYDL